MSQIFWLTGNSGAGKSTLATGLRDHLKNNGTVNVVLLDGDELRATISAHEDFSPKGRRSQNLRVAKLAKLLADQGHIVIICVIAPFQAVRDEVSAICKPTWIYIKRSGLETSDKPYEPPTNPDLVLDHDELSAEESVSTLVNFVEEHL